MIKKIRLFLITGILLLIAALTSTVSAGLLSSEPPDEFKNLSIETINDQYKMVSFKLSEFEEVATKSGTVTWKKESEDSWLMTLLSKDDVSGKITRINFLFKKDGNKVGPARVNVNGADQDASGIGMILMGTASAIGKPIKKSAQPDPEFMSSRLRDMGTTYSVTISGLVKFYNEKGATTSWNMNDFPPQLNVIQNGKKIKIGFQPGNAGEIFLIGHSLEKQLPSIDQWYVSKYGKTK